MATRTVSLVLESRATLDAFRRGFERDLVRRGFRVGPAILYDLVALGLGAHCYVRLSYDDRGFLLEAKVKTGFFGDPRPALHAVVAAARSAGESAEPAPPAP